MYTIFINGWPLRIRRPLLGGTERVALLLHGWTGDETSMGVFARSLPADVWVLSPRGSLEAPGGGYSWITSTERDESVYPDYARAAQQVLAASDDWLAHFKLDTPTIELIGFSMGAALVYTLLALEPTRFGRVAGLAGFLPGGIEAALPPGRLAGKQIFIAHGTQDDTVPVEKAHQAVDVLKAAGAEVFYCEDKVGHKLGASCNRRLVEFFSAS